MGHIANEANATPSAVEHSLPWGPTLRGLRWAGNRGHARLLHEPGADLDAWRSLPGQLAAALGMEVLAFDLPGHGLSDDPWLSARLPDLLRSLAADGPTHVVTAGESACAALALAGELSLASLICLSPDPPPSPPPRSPATSKLLFAGSLAGDDLAVARRLASDSGGWSLVLALPTSVRGTQLLNTEWSAQITEYVIGFLRDCLNPRLRSARPVPAAFVVQSDP